jgi:hypothetical protein
MFLGFQTKGSLTRVPVAAREHKSLRPAHELRTPGANSVRGGPQRHRGDRALLLTPKEKIPKSENKLSRPKDYPS